MENLKTKLSQKISDILRQEILQNKITEGDHFNEAVLAERFGVSRGPIREALRILETEGLVVTPPNGRTLAHQFTPDDIDSYYNLRYFIESESIKKILAAPADDSYWQWIDEMEQRLLKSREYLDSNDEGSFTQMDSEFHLSILTKANIKVYPRLEEHGQHEPLHHGDQSQLYQKRAASQPANDLCLSR